MESNGGLADRSATEQHQEAVKSIMMNQMNQLDNYRLSAVSSDTVDSKGVSALPKAIAQEDGEEETFSFAGLIETHSDQGDIFQQQERQLQGDKETVTDTTTGSDAGLSTA